MRVGSLFSGIGGFELGLERAGMEVVWQSEIDPYASAVLRKHWPNVPNHGDIRNVRAGAVEPVDVICGGFPCQDISSAGYKAGIDGAKSGLWGEYARVVGEIRPRFVLVENVSALLNRGLKRVLGDLAALGYDAEWHCLPASSFGAPHGRDRVWIVAYPDSVSEPVSAKHDEACGVSSPARSRLSHAECGERPLGWVLEGMRRHWERVARDSPWHAEDSPMGMGVDDGIPSRLDRLRCLGNSLVPQFAEVIGRAVMAA